MRLYSFFRSSAAFRVRIALNLKNVDYEIVAVNLPSGAHRSPDFLAINPQATVPTLDDDGTILWQSLAIIEYLDARFPTPKLIPAEPVARARVQALAQLIACELHPLNNLRVLKYLRGELKLDEAAVGKWYSHWVAEAFGPLETAGGIVQALPLLGTEPFVVVNSDVFTGFDYATLVGGGREPTLVLVPNPDHNPRGDFGIDAAGRVSAEGPLRTYAGIAVFTPRLFAGLAPGRRPLKPLLDAAIARREFRAIPFSGLWLDVGTPERLETARTLAARR